MIKCSCMHLLMVLATIQALCGTVLMQGDCRFRYINEPGPTTQSCNIIGSGVNITCYVEGDSFLDIQWHYSSDPSVVGVTNQSTYISIPNSLYSVQTIYQIIENDTNIRRDNFIISKVNNSTVGYYWCSIRGHSTPSQVVHIEQQCSTSAINSCNSAIIPLLSQGSNRCANVSNQNVSIVNAQDLQCDSISTPAPKTDSTPLPSTEDKETTTVENKSITELTTTLEDKSITELTTTKDKPSNAQTTQSATDSDIFTMQETSNMDTIASTATTIESGDGTSQGGGSLPTDIIWLAIGIVLAFLLVGVFILLAVIAALQCKKRRIKGVTSPTSAESAIALRDIDGQLDKKTEANLEPLYAEIPAAVPGSLIRLGIPNPLLISSSTSNTMTRDDHMMPLSPGSGQYVDMSVQLALRPPVTSPPSGYYETVTPDTFEHGRSGQRPSNSSMPNLPPVLDTSDGVFDDPKYDIIDSSPPTTKKHSKVLVSLSAPQEEHNHLETDGNDYKQILSEFTGKNEISRKLSYDSHTYTPVQPTQSKGSDYTFAIVSTEENYISEQGHLYHILESSTQSQREGSNSPNVKQSVSPVSNPDDCVFDEPSENSTVVVN